MTGEKMTVVKLTPAFSQPNVMGEMVKGGYGGGIPVVAFWTRQVGEAVGHVETIPISAAIPAKVAADGRVNTEVDYAANITLKPGETYSTPRSFVSVFAGDFYEPLRIWSSVLQKEGWELPKPSSEAYNVSWCGWGYEADVTPAQMLGTIPKLKEMGIKWVTLDDRWFDVYGDWNPRTDTFPGDSIKKMTDDFHKEGMLAQLWWLPLGVEDGEGKYESHKYVSVEGRAGASGVADPGQERQTCAHDSWPGSAVSGGAGGAGVSQATDGEIHSRLGIRRQQTGQYLQRSGLLQPGAPSQVAAGFGECDGRMSTKRSSRRRAR